MEKSTEKMQRKLFIKPYDRMVKDLVKDIQEGIPYFNEQKIYRRV